MFSECSKHPLKGTVVFTTVQMNTWSNQRCIFKRMWSSQYILFKFNPKMFYTTLLL